MLLSRYPRSFIFYNIILLIFFSLAVYKIRSLSVINDISLVLLHYVIIYLAFYYYRPSLFFIFFLCGIGMDVLLLYEFGPHLLVFMTLLIFFHLTKKYINNFNSQKIYLLIIIIQLIMILLETLVANLFFDYTFNFNSYLKFFFISIMLSYPVFFVFSKIDNLR